MRIIRLIRLEASLQSDPYKKSSASLFDADFETTLFPMLLIEDFHDLLPEINPLSALF